MHFLALLNQIYTAPGFGRKEPIMDGIATQISSYTLLQTTAPSRRLCHGGNCEHALPTRPEVCLLNLSSTTNFNVVIAVLSVFILLCKGIMFITNVFHPLISLLIHAALASLFAVSIHNQAGPDMSDPAHPQPGAPWYITKNCGPPVSSDLIGYCKQAKAAFSVTILML